MSLDGSQNELRQLTKRGALLMQRGEHQRAAEVLERAWRLAPANFDAGLNLGAAYILTRQFRRAAEVLEIVAEQTPDNAMLWTNLGAAYLGNPVLADDAAQRKAIAAFERALVLNPHAPNVAYNIGLIYKDRREYELALDWFQRAVQTNPADDDAREWIDNLRQRADGEGAA